MMEELGAWRIGACRISVVILRRRPSLVLKSDKSSEMLRVAEFVDRAGADKFIEAMRGGQQILFEGNAQPALLIDREAIIGEPLP